MFIVSVVQHIKIADLSNLPSNMSSNDSSGNESMDLDEATPDAGDVLILSRDDERSLARDATAGFAGMLLL